MKHVTTRALGGALLVGLAWGLFCWWGDDARWTPVRVAANLAGPWFVIAFWAGAQTRHTLAAAALGLLALLAAVLGYYGAIELFDAEAPNRISLDAARTWAIVAVPVGVLSGLAGALWHGRGWPSTLAIGLLGGVLLGEALLLMPGTLDDLDYAIVPMAELVAAIVLPVLLLDRREAARALVIVGVAGPIALITQDHLLRLVRDSLR